MKHDKRILMLINEFPPVGESGVQRPLKFVKYLVREGWQPFVVTPAKYPKSVFDYSLLNEVPDSVRIFKTPSLGLPAKGVDAIADIRFKMEAQSFSIKGFLWKVTKTINDFLFPLDKQIGWVPFALFKAVKLIRAYHLKNIYITGYPFSAFLVGIWLKKIYGSRITLVSDYRDAWQFEPLFETNVLPFRHRIIRKWDDRTLRHSDHVVFVTDYIRDRYCDILPRLKAKSSVIVNGFDEDDFVSLSPQSFDKPTIVYMGKFYSFKGNPLPLLRVIKDMPHLDLQFLHLGTLPENVAQQIKNENYEFYRFLGYKPHKEALNYSAGASINFIVINDDKESEGVYTGKLFELIRLQRPILALGPPRGIIKDLIESHNLGQYAHLSNAEAIRDALIKIINSSLTGVKDDRISERFSRQCLTRQLISIYDRTQEIE